MRVQQFYHILNDLSNANSLTEVEFEFADGRHTHIRATGVSYKHIEGRTPKICLRFDSRYNKFEPKSDTK